MNINFNFPIEIKCNSPGNDSCKLNDMKSDMFEGLFKSIGSIKEESKDIDYDLILSVLSNLNIINIQENIQCDYIQQEQTINDQVDDLNTIYEYISNKNINFSDLNEKLISVISSKENNVYTEDEISPIILQELNISNGEIEFLNNLKDRLNTEELNYKDILDYNQENIELEVDEEVLNLNKDINTEKYNELEVTSLSNKINLVQTKDIDKDLVKLESILNEGDSNSFSIINNINIDNKVSFNADINKEKVITNVRQDFISEDIIKTVKHLKSNELEQITVKITPKELGEMSIQLIKDADETKVKIIISKEDVYNLVNKNLSEITKHLEESNINVKEISVDIKNNNQKNFSDNLNNEFDRRNKENQQKKNKHKRDVIQEIENEEKILEDDNLNILI